MKELRATGCRRPGGDLLTEENWRFRFKGRALVCMPFRLFFAKGFALMPGRYADKELL